MSAPIIQFGTSRFLQAHADLMLSQARENGQDVGPITIVETTGSPTSRARVASFAQGTPFPVHIRGLENGARVNSVHEVKGVVGGISARTDKAALRACFLKAGTVISNTGDKGFALPDEPKPTPDDWTTFPELLTALLKERYAAGAAPIAILPCELVSRNGEVLRDLVLGLAAMTEGSAEFVAWIKENCLFINTLVDRIVSESLDPVGAVAEPYALWAFEDQPGFIPPCRHQHVTVVPDLSPFERRKLFILNLAHTLLAHHWIISNGTHDETVKDAMSGPSGRWLAAVMADEVLPVFPDHYEAPAYWAQCCERFANPYLEHRLADIAQNHEAKIDRRVKGFLEWAAEIGGRSETLPRLYAVLDGKLLSYGERRNAD